MSACGTVKNEEVLRVPWLQSRARPRTGARAGPVSSRPSKVWGSRSRVLPPTPWLRGAERGPGHSEPGCTGVAIPASIEGFDPLTFILSL